jgi:hypothetical protein
MYLESIVVAGGVMQKDARANVTTIYRSAMLERAAHELKKTSQNDRYSTYTTNKMKATPLLILRKLPRVVSFTILSAAPISAATPRSRAAK